VRVCVCVRVRVRVRLFVQEAPTLLRTRALKDEEKLSFHTITSYSWEDDGPIVKCVCACVRAHARVGASARACVRVCLCAGTRVRVCLHLRVYACTCMLAVDGGTDGCDKRCE
jgi:hypothetical protein